MLINISIFIEIVNSVGDYAFNKLGTYESPMGNTNPIDRYSPGWEPTLDTKYGYNNKGLEDEIGINNSGFIYSGGIRSASDGYANPLKLKRIPVTIVIPELYEVAYTEQGNGELATELSLITEAVVAAFNESESVKSAGISISIIPRIEPFTPDDPGIDPMNCAKSLTSILGLLTTHAMYSIDQHHIILMPCPSEQYADVFMGMDIGVPIVETRFNVVCTKHIAMFYEKTPGNLALSFSNALMRILGSPLYEYVGMPEVSAGDGGVENKPLVTSNFVDHILNDRCFINMATI